MTRHDHPPLTPEERALADRLARLGPHGGPPPALDAKILAAAREAVAAPARRNRRRWLGLSGGAGGLVTGLGLAASLTLVLGVVWQLRPHDQTLSQMREGPATEVEQVILVGELPSSEPRTRIVEPPAESSAAAPAAAADLASAAPKGEAGAEPEPAGRSERTESPPPPPPAADAEHELGEQVPAAATQKSLPLDDEALEAREDAAPAAFPASAPVAPPPPAAAPAAEATVEPSASRRATYTRAARAQPERAEKAAAGAADSARGQGILSAPPAEAYSAPVAADIADAVEAGDVEATGAAQATAVEHDAAALDRIEVTGNRIRGAEGDVGAIPLHEDRSLAPADWLERIRARRAAGDSDTARESLELFRKAHPHVRLPDDLLELLETADTDAAGTP